MHCHSGRVLIFWEGCDGHITCSFIPGKTFLKAPRWLHSRNPIAGEDIIKIIIMLLKPIIIIYNNNNASEAH